MTDAALIDKWWTEDPDANIGLAPGASNLIAFDIDHARAEAVAEAIGLFREPTLTVRTCRPDYPGAMHLYFQRPPFRAGNLTIGGALTIRCDAGHTVLPPSVHYSGRRYSVLTRTEPLPLPSEALDALRSSQAIAAPTPRRQRSGPTLRMIPAGERHETVKTEAARLAARCGGRMDRDELLGWVSALNRARCMPPLPDDEVAALVEWIVDRETQKPNLEARIAAGSARAKEYAR